MKLYRCEKPSQAKDIARVLGATRRGQGYIEGSNVRVTWAIGHLLESADPEVYGEQFARPWRIEPLPILPPQWQMTVKKSTQAQFNVIRQLLKQATEVVIATDADREGEVIARELLDYCRYSGKVSRLWLSALDDASVRHALANILPGAQTANLYQAGLGRARADWLVGINLTRLYTLKARELGIGEMLSIGRVHTPTLSLVVSRDHDIANFKPQPYWQVIALLEKASIRFSARWVPAQNYCDQEKRCIQQKIAQTVEQLCRQTPLGKVMEVTNKRQKIPAPLCFDLGTLQQTCSRRWGMGANQLLEIAQSLYETHKATTYPRTDCGYLPTSMQQEIPALLSAMSQTDPSLSPILASLDRQFVSRVWDDKKITAHHAIIPTRQSFDLAALTEEERQVYQLIRLHYLMQFVPLYETDITDATFNIGGHMFATRGQVVIVPGWKGLLKEEKPEESGGDEDDNRRLPALQNGETCQVAGAEIKALQTKPPAPFTEGTLIAAMKNAASHVSDPELKKVLRASAGLGTEATRAGILETLFRRGFIEKEGRNLHSTALARELVVELSPALKDPGMTALWEQALDDVAQGKLGLESFMQRQEKWTQHLVQQGKAASLKMTQPVTPPCPLCGGKTRHRQGKKGTFWSCIKYPDCKGVINNNGRRGKAKNSKSGRNSAKQ